MTDIEIGIPSRARADTISGATLRFLAEHGVSKDNVRVFVAGDERADYARSVDLGLCAEIVKGGASQSANRNGIMRYFEPGVPVVQMDDDVADVRRKVDDKQTETIDDFDKWLAGSFEYAAELNIGLWGVYPVLNPMFMRSGATTGLRFCIGQLFGVWNTHEEHNMTDLNVKNDYERTLRWWAHSGAVLRRNDVACKTRMYAKGGIQASGMNRRVVNRQSVQTLLNRYPGLVYVKGKRSKESGLEIALRRKDAVRAA